MADESLGSKSLSTFQLITSKTGYRRQMITTSDISYQNRVAVYKCQKAKYPCPPPFNPDTAYPEYPFENISEDKNFAYQAVRETLVLLKLDSENIGTTEWNPFRDIVNPGDKIVVKPNLVVSEHPLGKVGINASVVHGSIIRAIIDYLHIALNGMGRITIADSPIKEVDFAKITSMMGLDRLQSYYRNYSQIEIDIVDLRDIKVVRDQNNIIIESSRLDGDPLGYRIVDLGKKSFLSEIDKYSQRYRSTAAVYENIIARYHNHATHQYSIPKTILDADLVIGVSKLKTHGKAGVTLSLKNMVGITNEKRWLPHHRIGTPESGGDSYSSNIGTARTVSELLIDLFMRSKYGKAGFQMIYTPFHRVYSLYRKLERKTTMQLLTNSHYGGSWYGNDTVWRMVLDLNAIVFFCDSQGSMRKVRQRKFFSFIDGIIAGEGLGPLRPTPKNCGILVGGTNPVAVDVVAAHMMGCDYRKIPKISNALCSSLYDIGNVKVSDIEAYTNLPGLECSDILDLPIDRFEVSPGWKGHIELV
jgi:uncharacterized protein (DUF362 family)